MKKIYLLFSAVCCLLVMNVKSQTVAMDFEKTNCNATSSHLFQDLDEGKAVVLFYYMPSCGSCPPPAKKIQAMLAKIDGQFPGKVKAYAFPYNNTTTCQSAKTWVTTNNLSLFTPVDSGSAQVAYYGGFGMPTVVLVGGADHRVLFTTQNFATGDTTTMRDSILNLFAGTTSISSVLGAISSIDIFPNPAGDQLNISLNLIEKTKLSIELIDVNGKIVEKINAGEVNAGSFNKTYNAAKLPAGNYIVKFNANGAITSKKVTITH